MKVVVASLCLVALACLVGVTSSDRTVRSLSGTQFVTAKRNLHRVRRGLPVGVTNAYTGVEEGQQTSRTSTGARPQSPHRERVPLGRSISPDELRRRSYRVPRGPPVRITNAHTGIEESTEVARPNVLPADSSNRKQQSRRRTSNPTRPLRRRVRRIRKRRPASRRPASRHINQQPAVPTNHRFARKIVEGTLQNVRSGARLIGASGNYGHVPLVGKLIDNATLIRPNLVEGFDCKGRTYGYYADQLNECQVFHICVPMKQIFPDHFTENDVYHFSFICPEFTIFSQDAMVCAWNQHAVPCEDAHNLYYMNQNFFVVSNDDVQKETSPGYGQAVSGTGVTPTPTAYQTRPPPAPSAYQTRPPPAPSAYQTRPPVPIQPQPVAAGTYPAATGGVSSAATTAPPPPPAYPTPSVPQSPPPPPPAYPTQSQPQVQPQPQTPLPSVGYPSQRSETIETLPDTTQPEPTATTN